MTGAEYRARATSVIAITILVIGLQWFLFVAAPGHMGGPMMADEGIRSWLEDFAPFVAVAMQAIGLTWMIRIYRTAFDPEPDQGAWRYRGR